MIILALEIALASIIALIAFGTTLNIIDLVDTIRNENK
jgi:hypothetical protein